MKVVLIVCTSMILFVACSSHHQCPSYSDAGVRSADDVMKHHDKKNKGK